MGHRKNSAPRRGSLAFRPRGRAASLVPSIRTWPTVEEGEPRFLGFCGFKAGSLHVITTDDREKTPNFGKRLFNAATVLETPPVTICGLRAYHKVRGKEKAIIDVFANELPKELDRLVRIKSGKNEKSLQQLDLDAQAATRVVAIVCARPSLTGLSQEKPFLFELGVGGKDMKSKIEYVRGLLGKEIPSSEVLKPGMFVDAIAVSKGKGFEGPVTRHGIKRKQHKSRKSVRAVGVIGPWNPTTMMYTVPRAGQHGLNQRTEYNKRILLVSEPQNTVTPAGGFPHYGEVKNPYVILKGSVPGAVKRLVRLRLPLRSPSKKIQQPKIMEVSTRRKWEA
uniref:50S ribosomal protein L3 n=1 Tax=uncultured marine thaumarchaeote KM3_55_F05 TaxID=1456198 RepID=A0A075HD50_9ARCH|nr:ribosomal protein L3P (RP-L3, rplC) [uncultured marine thaumarchaeote KM3_55_F05]